MESESQGECSPASSRILVEKFVTRVWEHPLLDERTRRLRKNALETIVAMLSSEGIKKDSYFAMLAGSLVQVPEKEETSIDFDFIMVAKDSETLEKIKQFCFGFPKYEIAHSLKIHVLRTVSEADLTESRSDSIFPELAPLFLTPDDYIAGNVQAVRAARLKAMTFFKDQRRDPQGA